MQQQHRPIDDGVELTITDDNGNEYTIAFHVPVDGRMDIYANDDGSLEIHNTDPAGGSRMKINPSGGTKALGE